MCECYQIGGRFIAEDPDCPIHGRASEGRYEYLLSIILRVKEGSLGIYDAVDEIEAQFT